MEILSSGCDAPLPGAHVRDGGVAFAVFSEHAVQVELCVFDAEDHEVARLVLPEKDGGYWHGFVPGLTAGARYGYRAHGPYAPDVGHRFNANKLLIDPYARALCGKLIENAALYGYDVRSKQKALSFSTLDSAPFVPKALVVDDADWVREPDGPCHRFAESVIYEAHVKGLTQTFPGIDAALQGTFEGLAAPRMIEHLVDLGITAVELLPIHAFQDDAFLLKRGLRNYWGYNSYAFFAPEPRYMGPSGRAGLKAAIDVLHAAGIEVILDVVYNHTAESDHLGPTLNFRGLDNAVYYRLPDDDRSRYVNDTGCGNTLNIAHPQVLRLIMDSLRYWAETYGVDGFRFDLATTLGREADGFDPHGGFFDALRQDPVLAGVKLIAEPWDMGPDGYRLGGFPPGVAEWNDHFRDAARRFWRGDSGTAPGLASAIMGSAKMFDHRGRRPWSSLNFVTAHDGFTLRDTVSFAHRHNEANGEKNRDGHGENYSANLGVEGSSHDPDILRSRDRRCRNLLATLLWSQGTPMLLAGDEAGNSQQGNNNAYCQDNALGWVDWQGLGGPLHEFTRCLIRARHAHPALRQPTFLHGEMLPDGSGPNVVWIAFEGESLDWETQAFRRFAVRLRAAADDVILAVNGSGDDTVLMLPNDADWQCAVDTAAPEVHAMSITGLVTVTADSLAMFVRGAGHE